VHGSLPPVQLPADLSARPLTEADARAVFEVMAAQELHDLGTVETEEADIVGDWQRPSFDVSASTV
jgi:mycothiol synthase